MSYAKAAKPEMKAGFIHIQHGKIPCWSHDDLKSSVEICIGVLGE
ncbi:hypothetical protein [Psychrobacillus sp. OK032]|nr:hypothetical protein [Psychrobacillus sp. OK032]